MTSTSTLKPAQPSSKVVLLVDDNPTNLEVLFEALNQSGLKLLVAEDGEAALEQVDYMKPDIILMDIMMPRMDGFEACRRLKAKPETESIPIIFMTALNEMTHKLKGLSIGGVDYITKPIDPDEVLARVNVHLSLREAQTQLYEKNLMLQQEIQHRQRIEQSLKLLIRTVSHDLRNPVTGLLLVLKSMLKPSSSQPNSGDRPSPSAKFSSDSNSESTKPHQTIAVDRSILERMMVSATHQLELINSLMEAHSLDPDQGSRPQEDSPSTFPSDSLVLHRKPFSFHHLVDNVVSEVKPVVESFGGRLLADVPSNLPPIDGDRNQLWRVLENLITNAVKHNPPGITITIQAHRDDTHLVCQIADDGQGIGPEDQPYLFEPYHRVQRQKRTPGLGLGLYLCRQIIEAHGGQISLSSELGTGAVFQFTVPIAMNSEAHGID